MSAAGPTVEVVENDLCGGNSTAPLIDLRLVNYSSLLYFFGRRRDAQFTQPSHGAPVGGGAVLVMLPLPTIQAETVALHGMPPLGQEEDRNHVQGSAKEWSLGCVNETRPAARESQYAGITQPRDHS